MPENFRYRKLSNGLEVITVVNHQLPQVVAQIALKNGAMTEDNDFTGLSHLYEHMFFQANKKYPTRKELAEYENENGIFPGGQAREELVRYITPSFPDKLEESLVYLDAAMREPVFNMEDLLKERKTVEGEFLMYESDPSAILWKKVNQKLWGDNYYQKNTGGERDIILTATPDKLETIRKKYYYPNNAILVITGEINHEEAMEKAERIFSKWKPSTFNIFQKYPVKEFMPMKQTEYFIEVNDLSKTPNILYKWQTAGFEKDRKGVYAGNLLAEMLMQSSSPLSKTLLDSGFAADIYVGSSFNYFPGSMYLGVLPNADKMKETDEAVRQIFTQIGQKGFFTEQQLANAKASLVRGTKRLSERPLSISMPITNYWATAGLQDYFSMEQKITEIQLADIEDFVQKYLSSKPYAAGMIISTEHNKQYRPETFFVNFK